MLALAPGDQEPVHPVVLPYAVGEHHQRAVAGHVVGDLPAVAVKELSHPLPPWLGRWPVMKASRSALRASWSLAYRPCPAPGYTVRLAPGMSSAVLRPVRSIGADASWSPWMTRAGTWTFCSSAVMSALALILNVSSSTCRGVSTIIRIVQSTRPRDPPGLEPK